MPAIFSDRDLWHGADLAGGGKKRALWNAALLADGVAPALVEVGGHLLFFALLTSRPRLAAAICPPVAHANLPLGPLPTRCTQVLLAASRQLGPGPPPPHYWRLWPLGRLSNPWTLVADRVLDLSLQQPLLWSPVGGGRWVSPAEAVLLAPGPGEEGPPAEKGGEAGRAEAQVARLLLVEGLPVVLDAPPALVQGECGGARRVRLVAPVMSLVRNCSLGQAHHGSAFSVHCTSVCTLGACWASEGSAVFSICAAPRCPSCPCCAALRCAGLLRRHSALEVLSPALVRRHFRGRQPSDLTFLRPGPGPGAANVTIASSTGSSTAAGSDGDGAKAAAAASSDSDGAEATAEAGTLLDYCLSDLGLDHGPAGERPATAAAAAAVEQLAAELGGLPLLPRLGGGVVMLHTGGRTDAGGCCRPGLPCAPVCGSLPCAPVCGSWPLAESVSLLQAFWAVGSILNHTWSSGLLNC